jgi:tetratricopeptide (TPR) repeat protein/predicted Ser/Thr protein kinase
VAVRTDLFPPRYQNVRHVARGGMGDVYRATDTALGRTVALKLLAERFSDDEDIRRRFRNEALAAARLSNAPFTVTVFDVGDTVDQQPFIVMEFLEGGSLEERLRAGRPTTADTLRWLDQAGRALDAGHVAGVVHRDVKPGNLLLDDRGEVRVADFGVASAVGLDSLTMTGTVLGTAGYLSPEQARGERATPASDRYGLAVVAWELLTGRRPFESESMTAEAAAHVNAPVPSISAAGGLPPGLDPVFRRALAKEPAARYATAADFVAALREALRQEAATTARQQVAAATTPDGRRARFVWGGLALLAALLLGGGLALAAAFGDGDPQTTTVVEQQTITQPGTTVTTQVTETTQVTATAPATTAPTEPTTPIPPGASGVELTDMATQLLREGRWEEAEAVARQAVIQLDGSGELYEAYANYNLGLALVEQDRCDEAIPYLERSEEIQGNRKEIREARKRCEKD